jgi:Rrf2 family protein
MQITKEGHYALRAIIHLASSSLPTCSAGEISEEQQVPLKFLARIMPKLVKKGFVKSHPGSKGGYQLARPAREINFLEVLETAQGPFHINICEDERFAGCEHKGICNMTPVWKHAQGLLTDYFSQITFDQLIEISRSHKTTSRS